MPDETRELIEAIQELRSLLCGEGDRFIARYSINFSDSKPKWIANDVAADSIFERIDAAIKAIEASEQMTV